MLFDLILSVLVHQIYILSLVLFSRCVTNFKTVRLVFKFSIKTRQRVSYGGPRMLQRSLVIKLRSLCMTWPNFSLCNQSDFKTDDLKCSYFSTEIWPTLWYAYLLNVCVLYGVVRFLTAFRKLRTLKPYFVQILSSLMSDISSGHKDRRARWTQTHLNASYIKIQLYSDTNHTNSC